jgi:hypothetical protein
MKQVFFCTHYVSIISVNKLLEDGLKTAPRVVQMDDMSGAPDLRLIRPSMVPSPPIHGAFSATAAGKAHVDLFPLLRFGSDHPLFSQPGAPIAM